MERLVSSPKSESLTAEQLLVEDIESLLHQVRFSEQWASLRSPGTEWGDGIAIETTSYTTIRKYEANFKKIVADLEATIGDEEYLTPEQDDVRLRLAQLHDEVSHKAHAAIATITNNFTDFPPVSDDPNDEINYTNYARLYELVRVTCRFLDLAQNSSGQKRIDEIYSGFADACPSDAFSNNVFHYASSELQEKLITPKLLELLPDEPIEDNENELIQLIRYMSVVLGQDTWLKTFDALERSLTKYIGKEAERLFASWRTTNIDGYLAEELVAFIKTWQRLGREKTVRLVRQYGITSFKSIPLAQLESQANFAENGDKNKQVIAVLLPFSDHNGALRSLGIHITYLSRQTATTHNIVVTQIKHRYELLRRLSRIRKEYGSDNNQHQINQLIIGAHGDKDGMYFGPEEQDAITVELVKTFGNSEKSDTILQKDAGVILISCSTGAENGVAGEISERYGRTTHAPDVPTNIREIQVGYSDDGSLVLNPVYIKEGSLRTHHVNNN